jgi:dihydroflavonol-4-reductase
MKIGIIGATGMLGHHTAKAVLETGHELFVIHRRDSDLSKISDLIFQSRIGDLNDKASLTEALKGLDGVLNCGAYYPTLPLPLKKEMATAKLQMDNFIAAGQANRIDKMLYLGGSIALQKAPNGIGNETFSYPSVPEDKTPYVQVKWLMDKMAREAGLIVGIPTMTFGEYDWGPTTGSFVVRSANGQMPKYVAGNRNAVYAGDAGRGLLLALKKGRKGERYLIGGQNTDLTEVLNLVAKIAECAPPEGIIPLGMAKFVSKIQTLKYHLTGTPPQISATSIAIMGSGQHLDCTKAERELGYKATVNLEEALRRAFIWFKSVGYISKDGSAVKTKL